MMCSIPAEKYIFRIFISLTVTSNIYVWIVVANDTTYFQTRRLSGQQYGLDYNLKNYTNPVKIAHRPRTLFDWTSPNLPEETEAIKVPKEKDKKTSETAERVDKNVWWPWKNYDDWLTGRGQQKAEQPTTNKKKDKKTRKEKNKGNRRHNKKNGKKKKNPKTGKRHRKTEGDRNSQLLSINSITEDNEVTKKGSITELKYNSLPIDIVLRNNPSIPTLVKYTSRNYTYDVNECLTNNGGCEGLCINTPGSYRCHCPLGFMVADTKCEDIDECLLRNGHGPCQGSCANTWGGYKCSCGGLPGTKLSGDGHACDDVDECQDGTAGCSHQCINTVGSAFCMCPDGFQLDGDWKTCVDVDECSDSELQRSQDRCADLDMSCRNTYGSYECV